MPTANPNVVALFPLQEVIFDKDGTGPLAYGVVSFFSDPGFSVPKDVYEETLNPDNTITYTNLGNILILSGIGSFVDGIGNNFIPLLYPFVGTPEDATVGASQPYFITVYSNDGIFQFSASDWPPNSFGAGGAVTFQDALTANLLSNPNFSIVSFTPQGGGTTYSYSVTGNSTNPLAPGWILVTQGTGTVTVSQLSLNQSIVSESPYALMVSWTSSSTLSGIQIIQQLSNSPRILAGDYASASIVATSSVSAVGLTLSYTTPDGVNVIMASGTTSSIGDYGTIAGTALIPTSSTQNASGYADFVITIANTIVNSNVSINSIQMVEAASVSIVPAFIPQTTQQQLNGLMWYYEPQLAYKPIPSYTIGWDFSTNPCQELGNTVGVFSTSTAINQSRYIADQTIAFENAQGALTYTFTSPGGMSVSTTTPSQFAIVQYLDQGTARELLTQRNCVQIRGYLINGTQTTINGTVSLWWTANAALPVLSSPTFASMVTTLNITGGVATFPTGWVEVPRSGLGDASFTFSLTDQDFNHQGNSYSFSQWDATGTTVPQTTAKFFAIVVGFSPLDTDSNVVIDYCTLQAGDIPTRPPAMNAAQTLQALQYYYEKSYDAGVLPGTANAGGQLISFQQISAVSGSVTLYPSGFSVNYKSIKRTTAVPTMYAAGSNNALNVTGNIVSSGSVANSGLIVCNTGTGGTQWVSINGQYSVAWVPTSSSGQLSTSVTAPANAFISYQYVSDARFGLVV